jgi:hypothetical protein
MENDEVIAAHEKRRLNVYVDNEDVLARVLEVPEADYECVMVNASWPDKGLVEGDVVLVSAAAVPRAGDIVLIEEEGRVRLGLLSEPGFLETPAGVRPVGETERIIGAGVALARRLHKD